MNDQLSRRLMIARGSACLAAGAVAAMGPAARAIAAEPSPAALPRPFRYCFNTATIRGQNLPLADEVEVAAKAGYDGIEPWIEKLSKYAEQGGSLSDLRKRLSDLGLVVESAIGFPAWIVDDEAQRAKGMEDMKRGMDLVARLGGLRIAAPPAGANATSGMDPRKMGDRYRAVLDLGRAMGVIAQLEIWGASKTLGRVSEAASVAIEANHPDACLLLDAFHIYKSGCGFAGLKMLNWGAMHMFHMNDYPANPPRETISDADRVYPGDGVCPLPAVLRDMRAAGFRGVLSLEVFNREYWKQDALAVARTGLEKIKAVVERAGR